jgi:hypothetical protein
MSESNHAPSDHLITLCYHSQWDAALERVRLYPKEAEDQKQVHDQKEECALHWACFKNAPPHVVAAIAAADPFQAEEAQQWHRNGLPLDCLITRGPLLPDLKEKVLAILDANKNVAEFAAFPAFLRVMRHVDGALKAFPEEFPSNGASSFVNDHEREKVCFAGKILLQHGCAAHRLFH